MPRFQPQDSRRSAQRSPRALLLATLSLALLVSLPAGADLIPGLISDFEDGSLQGWEPPKNNTINVAGGPAGSTRFLQVFPVPRMAAFNASLVGGVIDPAVSGVSIDMMRPSGEADLEMRLVLFGPGTGNRWTSTVAQTLVGDGAWHTFLFSIAEPDLTQVAGSGSYAELTSSFNRLMFRYDAGAPSAQGTVGASGTIGWDNITAIPEPGTGALMALGLALLAAAGGRRS